MNVLLRNNLPPEPPNGARHPAADASQNPPHGFNTTNLHTHGLHVSPVGNSDNVFLELGPGQEFPLEIKIPRNHHPGTFWYHAHKHGSVALQLASGMAGALIVEGGLDDVPAIKCARDRVMVLQQIAYDDQGQVEKSYYDQPGRPAKTTINGRVVPEIQMRPGEVQRWRMIHAGIQRELNLTLDGHQLNEIACDGIALGTITPRPAILLCPGYRSDVLNGLSRFWEGWKNEGFQPFTSRPHQASERNSSCLFVPGWCRPGSGSPNASGRSSGSRASGRVTACVGSAARSSWDWCRARPRPSWLPAGCAPARKSTASPTCSLTMGSGAWPTGARTTASPRSTRGTRRNC
ncbi:MAG: multicopper oxidase domain-containing protein [Planctomycetaceae bacterium]|nr:multicopper oxidase domain-containing protein [Planctomycetaceae bacterium]